MVASTVNVNIGILAIQGGFTEHKAAFIRSVASPKLAHLNIKLSVYELRSANDVIDDLDGIVIPGGESTTMGRFLDQRGFGSKIKDLLNNSNESKRPLVWGTCAGLILLSNDLEKQKTGGQFHLGGLDVKVSRNFFGRQIDSFESEVTLKNSMLDGQTNYNGVFIRAPAVLECTGDDVEVLATITHPNQIDERPVIVGVRQKLLMATAFHPELTDDVSWHVYFIENIIKRREEKL